MEIDPIYDFVVRKPHKAAERIKELEAQVAEAVELADNAIYASKLLEAELNAAIDWHWNESVPGITRQDIVDNIKVMAEKEQRHAK